MRVAVSSVLLLCVTACGFEPAEGNWDVEVTDDVNVQCSVTDSMIEDGPMLSTLTDDGFTLAFQNGVVHDCTSDGEDLDCDDASRTNAGGSGVATYDITVEHEVSGSFDGADTVLGYSKGVWSCAGAGCGQAGWDPNGNCVVEVRFTATAP